MKRLPVENMKDRLELVHEHLRQEAPRMRPVIHAQRAADQMVKKARNTTGIIAVLEENTHQCGEKGTPSGTNEPLPRSKNGGSARTLTVESTQTIVQSVGCSVGTGL